MKMIKPMPTMKASKIIEPKDLGVKIGTPEEVIWTKVLQEAKQLLEQSKANTMIQQGVMELAESKIAEEQAKLKS